MSRRRTRSQVKKDFFNDLPEEIIVHIFSYLTQNQLGVIAQVCKNWTTITKTPVLWKNVDVKLYSDDIASFIAQLPDGVVAMKLDIKSSAMHSGYLNFRELCMPIKSKCPHIEVLCIKEPNLAINLLTAVDLCTVHLTKLKELGLDVGYIYGAKSTEERGDTVCQIKVLDLGSSCFEDFDGLSSFQMPHLKDVFICTLDITDYFFENVDFPWSQLETLGLQHTRIGAESLRTIGNHAVNLKRLYLCNSTQITDNDFDFNDGMFSQLETICIKSCNITSGGVVSLIRSVQSLKEIFVNDVAETYEVLPYIDRCKIIKNTECKHGLFGFKDI